MRHDEFGVSSVEGGGRASTEVGWDEEFAPGSEGAMEGFEIHGLGSKDVERAEKGRVERKGKGKSVAVEVKCKKA